jgi:hypothetical protein
MAHLVDSGAAGHYQVLSNVSDMEGAMHLWNS